MLTERTQSDVFDTLFMYYLVGMTVPEIAIAEGVHPSTIREELRDDGTCAYYDEVVGAQGRYVPSWYENLINWGLFDGS